MAYRIFRIINALAATLHRASRSALGNLVLTPGAIGAIGSVVFLGLLLSGCAGDRWN